MRKVYITYNHDAGLINFKDLYRYVLWVYPSLFRYNCPDSMFSRFRMELNELSLGARVYIKITMRNV